MSETNEVQKPPLNVQFGGNKTIPSPSPLKAIRKKCIDCCCNDRHEVRKCPCDNCPLWIFRMGHNPNRRRK